MIHFGHQIKNSNLNYTMQWNADTDVKMDTRLGLYRRIITNYKLWNEVLKIIKV